MTTPNFKDVIYCGWCKGNLSLSTKLIQFDCLHHGCIACLTTKQQDLQPGTLFSCPKCDLSCMVPLDGVKGFPEEPLLKKMKAIADIHANHHPNCEETHQENGSHVCVTCKVYFFEEDSVKHRGQPNHEIVTLRQLQTEPYLSQMLQSKPNICRKHTSEKKYHCKDCNELICMDCVVLEHSTHQNDLVVNVASAFKGKLGDELKKLEKAEQSTKEKMQKSQKILNEIQEKLKEHVNKHIRGEQDDVKFAEIILRAKIQRNNANLETQLLFKKTNILQTNQQYLKLFLKYCDDADIIEKYQFLMDFIARCVTNEDPKICHCRTPGSSGEDIGIKLDDISISLSPRPRNTTRTQSSLGNTESTANLNKSPEPWENRLRSCTLEAKWEGCDNKGVALDEKDVLLLKLGKSIQKYSMDGKKGDVIKCPNLKMPSAIDVYGQEIYVTDNHYRSLMVFDKDGQLTKKIELPPKEHIGHNLPLPLAVDQKNGDIVIASFRRNLVYKYSASDEQFFEWIKEGVICTGHICLTQESGVIASCGPTALESACKFDEGGQLQWKYTSSTSGEGKLQKTQGVCTDHLGQIFIADSKQHRIHVVSPHGQFLGFVDIGEEILSPNYMTFKDGTLVVTSGYKNTIYLIKCNYD